MSFKSTDKIVYKISYYKLGLSNFHRRYILKSPYVHGKWTVVEAFVQMKRCPSSEEED